MKNLKPSQLPENTFIHYLGTDYVKKADGLWADIDSGCGCCVDPERISDKGCSEAERWKSNPWLSTHKSSDEYFVDFRIIAVPIGFSFDDLEQIDIHGDFSYKTMTYADGTGIHNCERVNCEES